MIFRHYVKYNQLNKITAMNESLISIINTQITNNGVATSPAAC